MAAVPPTRATIPRSINVNQAAGCNILLVIHTKRGLDIGTRNHMLCRSYYIVLNKIRTHIRIQNIIELNRLRKI